MQYRWSSPQEWFLAKIEFFADIGDSKSLVGMVRRSLSAIDGDLLLNIFQDEAEADGYFIRVDLKTCDDCGEEKPPEQLADPNKHRLLYREQTICLACHHDWLHWSGETCNACHEEESDHGRNSPTTNHL